MATSPWPLIHAEREALAEDLSSLDDAQWPTPSPCAGWTVRDVPGHMTATAGSSLSLALAMTGRAAALDDLSGRGPATPRSRC